MGKLFYPSHVRSHGAVVINWNDVDTVLFDMDGTLLDLHYDNFFWHEYLPEKWGALHGLDARRARAELTPRLEARQGTLSWYCLDHWSAELGIDIMALKADIEHLIQLRPQAEELLRHVGRLGKRRVLVTNAHQALLDVKLARTGIGVHFDAIVSAHALGAPKEDVAFWHALRVQQAFDPERTLLLDDNLNVLQAATQYGLRHVLAIQQPDSRSPPRSGIGFPSVGSFSALLPREGAQE